MAIAGPMLWNGVGAGYIESLDTRILHSQLHKSDKEIADKYAFRSILADELDAEENLDFLDLAVLMIHNFAGFSTNYYGQGRVGDMNLL